MTSTVSASPGSVPEESWPELRRKLKASANFSKGRALLQQALALPAAEKRTPLLRESEASLLEAQRLNSADNEIAYLRGLDQLALGESSEAANSFAAAYRAGGELAPKALDNLRTIYQMLYPDSHVAFETFLKQAEDRGIPVSRVPADAAAESTPRDHAPSSYGGFGVLPRMPRRHLPAVVTDRHVEDVPSLCAAECGGRFQNQQSVLSGRRN